MADQTHFPPQRSDWHNDLTGHRSPPADRASGNGSKGYKATNAKGAIVVCLLVLEGPELGADEGIEGQKVI